MTDVGSIQSLAVIGAGEMGHGLAELAAIHGLTVRLQDVDTKILGRAMERIVASLDKLVEKGQISREDADRSLRTIETTTTVADATRDADFVIEAVFEDLEVKKKVLAEADRHAPEHAILASNTSGLRITEMAKATNRPDRVVGMHFFNPAVIMPLVEVVRGEGTSDDTVRIARNLAGRLGKTSIVCRKDVPGFITTRVIAPYMYEAAWIHHEEGVATEVIDSALRFRVGFPMGPFELADQVGLDLLDRAGRAQGIPIPPPISERSSRGDFGKKSGKGFYDYAGGKPPITPDLGKDFPVWRILAPVVNEASKLVEDGVAWPGEIDAAMRLATGFPKGPLHLADEAGLDVVHALLQGSARHTPSDLLNYKVAVGELGVKSGNGFFRYQQDAVKKEAETILVRKDEATGVATLTLNRPDRHNTISPQMIEEIAVELDELAGDEAVRCLVIDGAGERAFSAGADLLAFTDADKAHKVWRFSKRTHEVFRKLERFPKPTVAAIDGYCFGGGVELALACDFRIASTRSKMGQTEVSLGIIPGAGGTQRLTRLIGLAKAKELVLLGSRITAKEAEDIGLVTKAVDPQTFADEVKALAEKLAGGPPIAMRLAKAMLTEGAEAPLDSAIEMEALAFGIATSTEDMYEGLEAFMNKREPKFKGT